MRRASMLAVLAIGLLFAPVVLVVAPTAQACGFEEQWDVGPVEAGMRCTMPYVEPHPERVLP